MSLDKRYFEVKAEHIKLLRAAYIRWEDCEFGAPAIDCKRPYGNSSVYSDIAEILGIQTDADDEFSREQKEHMRDLHSETEQVLQIFLAVGYMKAGHYVADEYDRNWVELG